MQAKIIYQMAKIKVQNVEINVTKVNNEDYICLTDMIKAKDGDFFVTDWLRNRNTMEYLGIWENLYNPNFNYGEFATINKLICLSNMENISSAQRDALLAKNAVLVCHKASDSSNSIRLPSSRCRCWRTMKVGSC